MYVKWKQGRSQSCLMCYVLQDPKVLNSSLSHQHTVSTPSSCSHMNSCSNIYHLLRDCILAHILMFTSAASLATKELSRSTSHHAYSTNTVSQEYTFQTGSSTKHQSGTYSYSNTSLAKPSTAYTFNLPCHFPSHRRSFLQCLHSGKTKPQNRSCIACPAAYWQRAFCRPTGTESACCR